MLRKYLWIFFISMVPLIELRGAIPYAKFMNMPMLNAYIVAIIGNMIPVPFIYFFARKVLEWGSDKPVIGGFFTWCMQKGEKGGQKLQASAGKGLFVALLLFVGGQSAGYGFQIQRHCCYGRCAAGRHHHVVCQCRCLRSAWGNFRIKSPQTGSFPGKYYFFSWKKSEKRMIDKREVTSYTKENSIRQKKSIRRGKAFWLFLFFT